MRPIAVLALARSPADENVGRCRRVLAAASRIFRASACPARQRAGGFAQASAYRRVESRTPRRPPPPGWRSAVPRL